MLKWMFYISSLAFAASLLVAVEPLRIEFWCSRYEDYSGPLSSNEFESYPASRLERARIDISVDRGATFTNIAYGIPVFRGLNTYDYLPHGNKDDRAWLISEDVFIQVAPLSFLGDYRAAWSIGPLTFYGIYVTDAFVTIRRGMLNVTQFKAAGAGPLVQIGLLAGLQQSSTNKFAAVAVADCVAGTNNVFWVCPPTFPTGTATVVVQSLDDERVVDVREVVVTD